MQEYAKIAPVQYAYVAACEGGYIDVTTNEEHCDVVCSNYIFQAIVDLQRAVDESVVSGQEDLQYQPNHDIGIQPL